MEKKPTKFYGVFNHFSRTYEVQKFWIIKLCIQVSDIIHVNKHTRYANCGLQMNFWDFLLMWFCLWWKRIIQRKSCYFGFRLLLTYCVIHVNHIKAYCINTGVNRKPIFLNKHYLVVLLHTINFYYDSNYREIITNYKHISSTCNSWLFDIIFCMHLPTILL